MSTNGDGVMCFICTCPPLYSTRHFGNSLASVSSDKSILRMGDPLESSHKQNRDGVVGAQSRQSSSGM
ncbi:hypothetical protein DVH24_004036 [Malus domestica]|uniref:Uncharacterized protein n=1 Tax=Malus domestica TaxID=3750 RepID=A0A498KAK4_MALDO|nr:hypothetical protein DVH24_004036 [Malus domestica]